jgi:hypothetical protein
MVSRKDVHVKQCKPTKEQMAAAIKRATENVKTYVVWRDPKAPIRNKKDE